MDEQLLLNIQNRLKTISELKYVDEDWGQLNLYLQDIPVQWPCCLFEVKDGTFDNIGNDRKAKPMERQMGLFTLEITIGNLKLSNTSGRAPLSQKQNAWYINTLQNKVHEVLQGFSPGDGCSKLNRRTFQTVRRDDGVQEKHVFYTFEVTNC